MDNSSWLNELNPEQHKAVTFGDGPLLVVAGAGSGKTKTLASRVAYLISKGVSPDRILLLTFTRRASKEMVNRASQILGDQALTGQVWGGTFHATANRLLRIYAQSLDLSPDFTIIDQSDSEDLLDVIRHKKFDSAKKGRFPRKGTLLAIYSRRMNSGEDLDYVLKKFFPWCERWKPELKEIYKEYVAHKQRQSILDYDDLLLYWYYLLEDPKRARLIEDRFDHILVDEYQDTNKVQSDILVRMRQKNRNIMVVGDDAQSIYGFRAATVRNMLDFPKIFDGTQVVTLEQNYRSSSQILDTTNKVIAQAKERFSKNLFTVRSSGSRPQLITCKDESHESDLIVERILQHFESGIPLHEQAVLFRAGSHSATLELTLMKKNIPFHKYGGLRFLEAAHVKDFISFIRILENKQDEMAWFRVLQLIEGIGPATAAGIYEFLEQNNFEFEMLEKAPVATDIRGNLHQFQRMLQDITKNESAPLSSQLERISLFYLPLLDENYENPKPRRNDIEHIVQLASSSRSRTQFLSDLILDPPASTSDLAGPARRDEDHLILSTIHSSKGCEWDAVYLIHAADGCLPSDMSTDSDDDIAEELRLAYVAMTRAKNHLYVSWPLRFYSKPSGFSDRHVYSQCSRFFSADVKETMDLLVDEEQGVVDLSVDLEPTTDIKSKMKDFWD
jgi:DNA helicase-2/ATP-dependent DNA helicase PcrA